MQMSGQLHTPALVPLGEKTLVATEYKAQWAPGPGKSLGMPGFEPQTVQPVASHYTYYAVLDPVAVASTIIIQ